MNFARKYETVTLVHPDRGESGIDKVLGRIREALEKTGGREVRLENWGRKKLAYRLRRSKVNKANYLYMVYLGSNSTVAELERLLKITEEALLWQTILVEDRVPVDDFDFDAESTSETAMSKRSREAAERDALRAEEAAKRAAEEAAEAAAKEAAKAEAEAAASEVEAARAEQIAEAVGVTETTDEEA